MVTVILIRNDDVASSKVLLVYRFHISIILVDVKN